jgi:hypothetical protein
MALGVIAVALPIRTSWPARQPSPKKSPGPSIATTASLPDLDSTDSLMPPDWMYITCPAGSPWVKTAWARLYWTTLRAIPDESRKACASKVFARAVPLAFLDSMVAASHAALAGSVHKRTDPVELEPARLPSVQ